MARTRQAREPKPQSPTPSDKSVTLPHNPSPSPPPNYTPRAANGSLFIEPGSNPTILPLTVNSLEELRAAQVTSSNPDPLAEAVDSNQDPIPPSINPPSSLSTTTPTPRTPTPPNPDPQTLHQARHDSLPICGIPPNHPTVRTTLGLLTLATRLHPYFYYLTHFVKCID